MVKEGDTLPIVTWDMYRREKGVNGPIGYDSAWDKAPPQIWQKFKSDENKIHTYIVNFFSGLSIKVRRNCTTHHW